MSETPRNGDLFNAAYVRPREVQQPTGQDRTWYDDQKEYALAAPLPKVKTPHPWLYPVFVGAALIVGAICGAILTPNQTPAACEQALTYSEEGLTQSAKGLTAMGNAVGGNMGKMMKAQTELEDVTDELNRLSPLYKAAKEECLK